MTPADGSFAAYRAASSKLDNLSPQTLALANSLIQAGLITPDQVISGYRDPQHNAAVGGARNSQHTLGNAIDISGRGLTDEQRAGILQHAISQGAKGVGLYPGGSLHFDTRQNPAFWGLGGSYAGATADQAPEWAKPHIAGLLGQQVMASATPSATAAPATPSTASPAPTATPTAQGQPTATPAAPMGLLGAAMAGPPESAADQDAYQRQVMGLLAQATGQGQQQQQPEIGGLMADQMARFPQIQMAKLSRRKR